jgi:hypothetical protein
MQAVTGFGIRGTVARPVTGVNVKVGAPAPVANPARPVPVLPNRPVLGTGNTIARPVIMGGGGTGIGGPAAPGAPGASGIGAPTATGTTTGNGASPVIEGAPVTPAPAPITGATCAAASPELVSGIPTVWIVGAAVLLALSIFLMDKGVI